MVPLTWGAQTAWAQARALKQSTAPQIVMSHIILVVVNKGGGGVRLGVRGWPTNQTVALPIQGSVGPGACQSGGVQSQLHGQDEGQKAWNCSTPLMGTPHPEPIGPFVHRPHQRTPRTSGSPTPPFFLPRFDPLCLESTCEGVPQRMEEGSEVRSPIGLKITCLASRPAMQNGLWGAQKTSASGISLAVGPVAPGEPLQRCPRGGGCCMWGLPFQRSGRPGGRTFPPTPPAPLWSDTEDCIGSHQRKCTRQCPPPPFALNTAHTGGATPRVWTPTTPP